LWTRRTVTTLHIIGTAQDVENVRRLFAFCLTEIERLCREWGRGEPVRRRNDFKTGASRGVCDLVQKERDQVMQTERERSGELPSRALQLFERKDKASRDYARDIGIYLQSHRSRSASADAFNAGYEAGSQLDLNRPKPKLALPAGK
jgi:hypothetical protein